MTASSRTGEETDFSLVLGGPLDKIFKRAHLQGPVFELMGRRVIFIIAITWLPLLALSAFDGRLVGAEGSDFASDIGAHVRFLFATPLLIVADWFVHVRLLPVLDLFRQRDMVVQKDFSKFRAGLDDTAKARDSVPLELALLLFVATVGHWVWRREHLLDTPNWYAVSDAGGFRLTLPGYWYAFISIPIAQFFLFRWYLRLAIWSRLLWRLSRLDLRLLPTHADRAGGLAFLGTSTYAFTPILFAQGAVVAGVMANRILYQGQSLRSFEVTVFVLVGFFVVALLGPLTFFTPQLIRSKRTGWFEYGTFATTYSRDFDEKWLRGAGPREGLLGTGDIQSLADLANSFAIVREMRLAPFSLGDFALLLLATTLPLVPVVLLVIPLEDLLSRLVKAIV